ncbi:MAG: hypothetical protein R3B40_25860 [Polyangiales bacterium]
MIDSPSAFPHGYSSQQYVEDLIAEHGSVHQLASLLADRCGSSPESERKAIQRLRSGAAGGGAVQARLVKHFGVPQRICEWLKWMAQYHSRFADMPTDVCHAYVTLWDRAPVNVPSKNRVWISLAKAQVALRMRHLEDARAFLSHTRRDLKAAADPASGIEYGLCSAYLTSWDADGTTEAAYLDQVEAALSRSSLSIADRHCYHARWVDQTAYRAARIAPTQDTFADSLKRYEHISADTRIPFVDFRRAHGRATCLWKLGRTEEARVAAAEATTHAGDGGYVRLRSMALKLQSLLWQEDPARSAELMERSLVMATRVRDEELLHRIRLIAHASRAAD